MEKGRKGEGVGEGVDDEELLNEYNVHYLGDKYPKSPELTNTQVIKLHSYP